MKHWRKLLSFLLIHLLLAEATNPPCSNEECYILLERDLNNTQQQILSINNSLEETSLHLTATLQLLDDTTATVDDTYQYAQHLNASEALLLNTYNSVRDGLAASHEQIYNLSDMLTLISANTTYIDVTSSEAVVTVNQTIEHIVMAAETLDEVEVTLLPMIESVATSIAERNDNGTELYTDLMMQLSLVTSQASQLFNISWSSLNIINATIESLIDSSALQNDVSADITMQTVVSETIRNQTESLSNELTSIQQIIRFYTVYISEIQSSYLVPSMDQLNRELLQAVQLTEDVMMLLQNISMLTNLTYDLYAAFSSYEESYQLLPGRIQTLEQDTYTLYNYIALLNQNASMASQEADQLVTEAQYLQMVLQNFSGFVDTATEVLQSVEAIQMSAMDTINTANNISDMIMETCQTANDTLLALMQSSDLAESVEMTLNGWSTDITNAVSTTQDLEFINSSRISLEVAEMTVENIMVEFISQQESINETEAEVENAVTTIQDATDSCDNASASVAELQVQLENITLLSDDDIADISDRITQVELNTEEIQNIVAILTREITEQTSSIDMLKSDIESIMADKNTLEALYNSLPRSCDDNI